MSSKSVKELEAMFHPRSVAIIGASSKEGKIGHTVIKNMQNSNFPGKYYPINPKSEEILGYKAYKSIMDAPDGIDMAIICIPSKFCVPVVEECGKKKVKTIVIITAGFKEVGGEGRVRESRIQELGKQYNMRILGPNCLGLITNGNFSFANQTPKKGKIAMLSQSGAMMTGLLDWAVNNDIGFSSFISIGNKADIDEVDLIEYLAHDDNTKVIAAYIESVQDGMKFFNVVSAATKIKPVILLKAGRSAAGAKAASSHTGALAGSDIGFELAFKKAGVLRADTISELFNYALTFLIAQIPKGDNFAIVTNAGGPGIVTTDAMDKEKLGFAQFTEETINLLKKELPAESNFRNPVDIIGDAPPSRYEYAIESLCQTPNSEVAGIIILLTPQSQTEPLIVAQKIAALQKKYPEKIMIGAFIGGVSVEEPMKILTSSGVPTYAFPEDSVKVLKGLTYYKELLEKPLITEKVIKKFDVDRDIVKTIIEDAKKDHRAVLLSYETSQIFETYGIKAPKSRLVQTARDAAEIAKDMGFPLVAKIVSPQIIHKWDVGGVILNIKTPDEAKNAFISIMTNAIRLGPRDARLVGVELQEMIIKEDKSKSNELIIGMSRDPNWGPMLMIGSGGIYANYVKDVAFDLAYQFDRKDARKLLHQTKISKILEGVRGEPESDIEGVLDILERLSQLVNDFPDIVELDINPCLVFSKEEGYSAVDIKITIKM
ncbi:acetate--CoA ligase alpha subunit [Promethearchaeum syntrophicum]|uniref:Acetate--CoA ligase alpha subunit n=1 Tax=Promethearchaeum syntrophicum TaxID=2594042 RepID=A0A5B9D5Y0_9ARCH|nr:acetate--CoA ligase [Candidatus Prometheoarchaeum syntrophicum]QEE14351.1 succinyl-CoA synthetase subunit alpha [Candidatus Prometheoarchaeum syntrophicum]